MKKTVLYDKIHNLKVTWDGNSRFDVLFERHSDEWVVIDTFLHRVNTDKEAFKTANNYILKLDKETA